MTLKVWRFFILPLTVFVFLTGEALAADLVVLSASNVKNLRTGTVLTTNDQVNIPKGSSLILITERGLKVKVEGPFSGTLAAQLKERSDARQGQKVNLVNAFAKLFNSSAFSTKAMGAFRSLAAPALSDPWAFNVNSGGTVCFQRSETLKLWRSSVSNTDTVSLQGADDITLFELPRGQAFVPWPVDVPRNDLETYELTLSNDPPIDITLRTVPGDMPTRMHAAAWMSENGCSDQATLLIVNADIDKLLQGLAQSGKF